MYIYILYIYIYIVYLLYRSNQPLWKNHTLHKLILIVLQLTNQIK